MINMRRHKGVTLVELIIASAIFSIIVLCLAPMFRMTTSGFTSYEAGTSLKRHGQEAINRLGSRLAESTRLFENTTASKAFLTRAQITTPPSALSDSKLAVLEETGGLSLSTTSFVQDSVGNSLFFASGERPEDLTVQDSLTNIVSVRIDKYVFYYYFLAPDTGATIAGQEKIDLWEWHSESYANYDQINAIGDSTTKSNVVGALVTNGVGYAWDPSQTNVSSAFYTLQSDGTITGESTHTIPEDNAKVMIKILTGTTGGGYRYGISPNTGSDNIEIRHTVPELAAKNDKFPSGFEVVAVGPNSARQIFIRIVLVAEGSFKGTISSEQTRLVTARDLW